MIIEEKLSDKLVKHYSGGVAPVNTGGEKT